MTKFLLDANLSPKVARFLETELGLDVLSLRKTTRSENPDQEVMRYATSLRRVIITLDRDFAIYRQRFGNPTIGVIYLDVHSEFRKLREINRLLAAFFSTHGDTVDFENSLVVITAEQVRVTRSVF